ncbi:ABC transporter substrate-binding protein [Patescibacteria group bacterium]
MKQIFSILKKDIRLIKPTISKVINSFSRIERLVFFIFLWVFIIGSLFLTSYVNKTFTVEVPAYGGSISEGIVGVPRFINPLLAVSDADRDVTTLVYSGLMRANTDGSLTPDLAETYSISEDGLVYSFTLKEDIYFHDGVPVTADDILFTASKAQDQTLKSPKRASWEGVLVEKINDREITFTLSKPYAPFLENTTLGILPKHIWEWENSSTDQFNFSQFNIDPIGSGPYEIDHIEKNSSGIPDYYDFVPFKKFVSGKPYINKLRLKFYANEELLAEGLHNGEISAANAIQPRTAEQFKDDGFFIRQSPLPRVFGVFFNQNQSSVFADLAVRKALNYATNKERIVDEVLHGYGTVIDSPIPPGSIGYIPRTVQNDTKEEEGEEKTNLERAQEILSDNGWRPNEKDGVLEKKIKSEVMRLEFSLSTSDISELKEVAQRIKEDWESIGASVTIKVFEAGDLNQNVIRPRKYDALLFGEIVGRDSDLFAFWHSSQRNDPGLNIALYANISSDKALEDARSISDIDIRIEKYKEFQEEIKADVPAVFIYAPNFIYVLPENIKGASLGSASTPSERFLDIHKWFIETDHVWKIFSK